MAGSDKPELDEVTSQTPLATAPPQPAAPSLGGEPPTPSMALDDADASYLDAAVQGQIGRQLRSMYDSLVEQPVPDRFLRLLEELERKGHTPA